MSDPTTPAKIRPLFVIIGLVALGATGYLVWAKQGPQSVPAQAQAIAPETVTATVSKEAEPQLTMAEDAQEMPVYPDDMVLGNPDAKVTVIEYASMTCPHCAHFHKESYAAIKAQYLDSGKVRLVFRNFFWDQKALDAAVLARCAGADKFFAFTSVLFEQQESWATADDHLSLLAQLGKLGGVSEERYQACRSDKALVDSLMQRRQEASSKFGVDSTPTFFINGRKVDGGEMTPGQFAALVDPLLK